MILDTNKIEEKALANFKGGEKALNARMHIDCLLYTSSKKEKLKK